MEEEKMLKFDKEAFIKGINDGLALRSRIEETIDQIVLEKQLNDIYFVGIGGTLASAMQAETYAAERCSLNIRSLSAAEYNVMNDLRIKNDSLFICSSVSGNTPEMLMMAEKARRRGIRVLAFVDNENTKLEELADYCIIGKKNEQLKFFMCINYLAYLNGEMDDYEEYNSQLEENLAAGLAETAIRADEEARNIALAKKAYLQKHPEMPQYLIGAGIQYGATVSHGMCYWEEQLWIRTRVVHAAEFFHGCFEVIEADTPVILYMEEGSQRVLSQRVLNFLEKYNHEHIVIDSRDYPLPGISEEYRASLSHLIIRTVNDRIDTYLEAYLNHSLQTRRYYRKFDY